MRASKYIDIFSASYSGIKNLFGFSHHDQACLQNIQTWEGTLQRKAAGPTPLYCSPKIKNGEKYVIGYLDPLVYTITGGRVRNSRMQKTFG